MGHRLKASFTSPTFYIGLIIAALALILYAGAGVVGTLTAAYAVFGLALGVTLAVVPGASPWAKLVSFLAGGGLAFLSFVIRGALLPDVPGVAPTVVFVTMLVIAVVAALTRNPTCLLALLLGAGAVFGLSEVAFSAAPVASVATSAATLVAVPLSLGLGFIVPQLFGLTLGDADLSMDDHVVRASRLAHSPDACAFCPIRFGQREAQDGRS